MQKYMKILSELVVLDLDIKKHLNKTLIIMIFDALPFITIVTSTISIFK